MSLHSWLDGVTPSGRADGDVYIPDPLGRLGRGGWGRRPDPFGRLRTPDWKVGLFRPDDDVGITLFGPVGSGAADANRPEDVAKVERLLGAVGHLDLGETDGPTGYYGARLKKGIERFQAENNLVVDGVLNPGGGTIRALGDRVGKRAEPEALSGVSAPRVELPAFGTAPRPADGSRQADQVARIVDGLQAMDRAGIDWRKVPTSSIRADEPVGYPQTGGKPAAGSGGRRPNPGESQVAVAPAVLVPWALGALGGGGAGIVGKQLYDKYGKVPAPGAAAPDGKATSGMPPLPPEVTLQLYGAGGLSNLVEHLFRRAGGAGDGDPDDRGFDAIDRPLPSHTETPAESPRMPGRIETPADPTDLPDRTQTLPERPRKPEIEMFPDQSSELPMTDIVSYKKLARPNDFGAGERPDPVTQRELNRLPPRLRQPVEELMLQDGIQNEADWRGAHITEGKGEGKDVFDRVVRAWGGDPANIKPKIVDDKRLYSYKNPQTDHKVVWREFSSKGQPTLVVQVKRPGKYFELKKRFSP
ncbi:peptidoglycan-binding domain-containing protein [Shumkonia mesophila]|uniref:peptidoglycan-binding domain-containing protein n=1 Tax=Shumkonia mesophila TaxID=2838854 RepID=UPI0029345E9D|nr:peptidoglycan-binding domain-containing protein [Shumkonia mesophila]